MKAAYIGSFDPVTNGHVDVIIRATKMYDQVYIAIGENSSKKTLFTVGQRKQFIYNALKGHGVDFSKITITSFTGLAVDFMRINGITTSIRGVRNATDVEYEGNMNLINRFLAGDMIETVYVPCNPKYEMVSSSTVKMLVKSLVDVSDFVCLEVKAALEMKLLGIFLVGIVGKSGSGKSTYCKSIGLPTIDFDQLVRYIWDSDDDDCIKIRMQILTKFNERNPLLLENETTVNKINLRKFLERKSDNEFVRETMKPYIDIQYRKALRNIIDNVECSPPLLASLPSEFFPDITDIKPVVLDAPMLLEYGGLSRVNNMIINIHVPEEVSIARLTKRDGLTEKQIKARLNRQMDVTDTMAATRNAICQHGYGYYHRVDGN